MGVITGTWVNLSDRVWKPMLTTVATPLGPAPTMGYDMLKPYASDLLWLADGSAWEEWVAKEQFKTTTWTTENIVTLWEVRMSGKQFPDACAHAVLVIDTEEGLEAILAKVEAHSTIRNYGMKFHDWTYLMNRYAGLGFKGDTWAPGWDLPSLALWCGTPIVSVESIPFKVSLLHPKCR
jgi:hypothetical protein